MVNKFGDDAVGGGGKRGPPGRVGRVGPAGKRGKAGPVGGVGPSGKRGKAGENVGYYAQYFQHSKTKWDVDFKPNFWIEGYDIEKSPFKVLNKYDHKYNAVISTSHKEPTKGTDSASIEI